MRKIIQIAFYTGGSGDSIDFDISSNLNVLCDDGTIWYLGRDGHEWKQWELPEIPQEEGEGRG